MKTIATLLFTAFFAAIAAAGETTIFNDSSEVRFVRVTHKGQNLASAWLLPGQMVVVQIDETRRGKPLLMIGFPRSWEGQSKQQVKFYYLPKKPTPQFFALSWFKWSLDS